MSLIMLPILVLNFFAGIVGGIWLAIVGEWGLVGYGLGITIFGVFAASLLLMPGILLALPAAAAAARGNIFIAAALGIPSVIYTYCIMGIWAIFIYSYFTGETKHLVAAVLWSYSTSTATWSYMAQKEMQTNEYSAIAAVFHQFGCISLGVYCLIQFPRLDWEMMVYSYGFFMVIGAVIQSLMVIGNSRHAANY